MNNGTLYIIGTPIGNLDDITYRAIKVLKDEVEIVYCEDTRQSRKLLNHYNINLQATSLHAHTSDNKINKICENISRGKTAAYLTDSGTPAISDPGSKFVNYDGMIPVLVESIKELQSIIETQGIEIKMLKEEQQSTSLINIEMLSDVKLYQNNPNPFSENTIIRYYLPENVVSANIYIYDMNGRQLKNVILDQRGEGNVLINGGELNAGMYIYTMIADGQTIGDKRMILTD